MLQTLGNADCITEFTVSSTNFDNLFYVKLNTSDISNIDSVSYTHLTLPTKA